MPRDAQPACPRLSLAASPPSPVPSCSRIASLPSPSYPGRLPAGPLSWCDLPAQAIPVTLGGLPHRCLLLRPSRAGPCSAEPLQDAGSAWRGARFGGAEGKGDPWAGRGPQGRKSPHPSSRSPRAVVSASPVLSSSPRLPVPSGRWRSPC